MCSKAEHTGKRRIGLRVPDESFTYNAASRLERAGMCEPGNFKRN